MTDGDVNRAITASTQAERVTDGGAQVAQWWLRKSTQEKPTSTQEPKKALWFWPGQPKSPAK